MEGMEMDDVDSYKITIKMESDESSEEAEPKRCCVAGCHSTISTSTDNITFHTSPNPATERERYSKWVAATRAGGGGAGAPGAVVTPGSSKINDDLFVCDRHFKDHPDDDNQLEDTLPTLNLPVDDAVEEKRTTGSSENKGKKKTNYRRCMAFGCNLHKNNTEDLTFFSMPQSKKERLQWIRLLGRRDWLYKKFTYHQVACEHHFDPRDILNLSYRKTLKRNVLPSVNLPVFKRLNEINTASNSNTTNRTHAFENFHSICDCFLSPELSQIVQSQTDLYLFDKTVRTYKPYKLFCLRLFHTSVQAYLMLKNFLTLPPIKRVKNTKITVSSHLNDDMVSTLKMEVKKMTATEKNCAVIVGTIDVKRCLYYNIDIDRITGFEEVGEARTTKPANHVIVLLAQGIVSNWMQPVGYAMISDDADKEKLSKWIDSVIRVLQKIGFNVRAFVTGLEEDFAKASQKRCVNADEPFFFINDKKIYYIYDNWLLMQAAYRSLHTHDFYFENSRVAKFQHLVDFYWQDLVKVERQAAHLTFEHIAPLSVDHLTIKHADEALSKAVATGISTHVSFKYIEESGEVTAQFILLMNTLKEFFSKKQFCGTKSQVSFLSRMVNVFYSLQLFDQNGEKLENVIFKDAFEITIRSTLLLIEDLKLEEHTCMNVPNLDEVRNLNKKILAKYKKSKAMKPTCQQFLNVFRTVYLQKALQPIESGRSADLKNIVSEYVAIVKEYNEIIRKNPTFTRSSTTASKRFKEVRQADYKDILVKPNDKILKICGYLLLRCLQYHPNCTTLIDYTCYNESKKYTAYKRYMRKNASYRLKVIPTDDFVSYIEVLDRKVSEAFDDASVGRSVAASLYERLKGRTLSPLPCPCFPSSYLLKLFIRMKLFFIVKFNNRTLRKNQAVSANFFS